MTTGALHRCTWPSPSTLFIIVVVFLLLRNEDRHRHIRDRPCLRVCLRHQRV